MLQKVFLKNSELTLRVIFRFVHVNTVQNLRSFDSIPRPFQLPMLGNWHLYKFRFYDPEKYHEVLHHLYKTYGPIVYERIGWNKPIIHVFEPEDAETVYRNEDKMPAIFPLNEFTKAYREQEHMTPGLGNTNDEEWYKLRNGIRRLMMKTKSAQRFLDVVDIITDDLVITIRNTRNRDGEVRLLHQLIGRWVQEVAGKICFDRRLGYLRGDNEEHGNKVVEANAAVFKIGGSLKFSLPFYNYFEIPKFSKLRENEDFVHKTAIGYVNEALQKIEQILNNNVQDGKNFIFLSSLLENTELSRKDVTIIIISLFIDGLTTTAPTLLSILYALAVNENVQNKVFEEICSVSASNNADRINFHIMNECSYLKAVIKETFRMYPNGTEIARINKKPLLLSGYYIPPETNLSINLLVNYKSEKYFTDPHTFKPERWLRSSEDANVHPFLLAPFGIGARTCAGRRFAEQDLFVSLYKILKHFRLEYPPDAPPIDFLFHTLLRPAKNLPIRFIPR